AYTSVDTLQWATAEQLCAVEDVGPLIAENIVRYFEDIRNLEILDRLRKAGLQMALSDEELSALNTQHSTTLAGLSIVISGTFSRHSRDEYKAMIEANGGKNVGSVSKKTSFILAGENMGPEKRKKAETLGVKMMSEEEFLEMIK
ncbi:MAG: NAD-dependent DNA ligase LigA, partial [Paludibacteraceae bacterium]|nr:NAD-dependent DNA ligase LigA [Paludibacteraceae bacterium]